MARRSGGDSAVPKIPSGRVARGRALGKVAAGQALRAAGSRLSVIGRSERAKELLNERLMVSAIDQLVVVLGGMKGAAMKLGQTLSMLELEMLPPVQRERVQARLASLRDDAPQLPFSAIRQVIEADLGPLETVFSEFDECAIASASIGQVHRARLLDGRDVAVKVQYPGIDKAVQSDLRLMAMFAKALSAHLPAFAHNALVDEVQLSVTNELDYLAEARVQHRLAQRFRGHPFIVVPDAIVAHSSRRVLVSEFFEGVSFETVRGLPDEERDRIGELVYRFYIGSLFRDNEFCGDPHLGNVLLGRDGRVGFVDFGLYKVMQPSHVEFERQCLRAAAEGRAADLYDLFVGRGIVQPDSGLTVVDCLDYVDTAAQLCLIDEKITVTTELATAAMVATFDPRGVRPAVNTIDHWPADHFFSRRADFMAMAVLGQLRATANWHRIAREWLYNEPPETELGKVIAEWRLT
ncbi:AarF/ABC1/UbiB kinase family protein [Nocardia brasiliensis]|uniref:AarF/ABC1/UbiB kinase family protein n=1 Tax=Nocardia brasiliensis TaxID=37326 RepID=A0A6G9Y3A9_NOCBR|nr:AarF/ABC1/UbiB kinase family protein [Nocardia brasiliensis]QIS07546.1 AarF/ABC1/UbiB kinase family protein [Nocardia brasiliensis]